MNQRIEVRSLIRKDGKILLLKRAGGHDDHPHKFELPGGRIDGGEQPEEAVRRTIKEAVGLQVNTAYLSDVFTYVSSDKPDVQRAVIVYVAGVAGEPGSVELNPRYGRYAWKKPADVHQDDVNELSFIVLAADRDKPGITASMDGAKIQTDVSYSARKQGDVIVYSDGGSRGNPGPSAAGYVIKNADEKLMHEGGAYLGITTNNQAEYHGVRLGLEKARELGAKSAECYVDSMLVVNQLNGQYIIRNRELWPIHERIKELIGQFDKVTFRHVKRELNQQADGMVNKILDARAKKEVPKV